jgi:hypothetical protein
MIPEGAALFRSGGRLTRLSRMFPDLIGAPSRHRDAKNPEERTLTVRRRTHPFIRDPTMHDPRQRLGAGERSNPNTSVPESQNRALDRRHSLAEQQRAFQGPYPPPYLLRRRPPN